MIAQYPSKIDIYKPKFAFNVFHEQALTKVWHRGTRNVLDVASVHQIGDPDQPLLGVSR